MAISAYRLSGEKSFLLHHTYIHCVRDGEAQITFVGAPAVGVDVSSQLAEDLLSVCTILRPCILSIDRASTVTVPVHFSGFIARSMASLLL